jgi:hypothetical protein
MGYCKLKWYLSLHLQFYYHIDFELLILGDPAMGLIRKCFTKWVLFRCASFLRQ